MWGLMTGNRQAGNTKFRFQFVVKGHSHDLYSRGIFIIKLQWQFFNYDVSSLGTDQRVGQLQSPDQICSPAGMKPPSLKDEQDVSHISGNVPPHIKRALSNPKAFYESRLERKIEAPVFFEGIQERLLVKEISVRPKSADVANCEGRVVVELDVEEGVFARDLQVVWL